MTRLLAIIALVLLPVFVAADPATFGKTDIGSSDGPITASGPARAVMVGSYTASSGDSVLWIHAYLCSNGGNDSIAVTLYDLNGIGGAPDNRSDVFVLEATGSFPTGYKWDSVEVNIPLIADTTYVLAVGQVGYYGVSTKTVYIKFTTGSSGDLVVRNPFDNDDSTLTDPWGINSNSATQIYSIYATLNYEAAAATGPPNARHSPDGVGVRHSPDGASARHSP